MNIAFDASAIMGRSGIERYSRELIRALLNANSGIVATLITGKGSRQELECFLEYRDQVRVCNVLVGERLLGGPMRRLMRMVQRLQWDAAVGDVDLVHILGPQKVLPNKRPLVVTIHDLFPMYEQMGIEGQLRSRFPRRIARQLRAASAVMCPSAYVASTVRECFPWYNGPVSVTPLAAGDEFAPRVMSEATRRRFGIDRPYLVFIGRIDGRKNLDRMLHAWRSLPQATRSSTKFIVVIAGGAGSIERFRAEHSGVLRDESIHIATEVSTVEMVELLSGARALTFATLGEGFGLPVIEAMKCGCPVITSLTTSLPEVGGDAALYVDPTVVDDIAQAMQRCIDDDDLTASMRARGFVRASRFTWHATAMATLEVYNSVIGSDG